jgi:chemotaxis protein MotB
MKNLALGSLVISVFSLSACVTSGKYGRLEEEKKRTDATLVSSEARVSELEKKLGVASTAKTRLEGSVSEMKVALDEMSKRKAESEKRIAEFQELTAKFKPLVDSGKLSVRVVNGRMVVALSTDILFPSGSARLSKEGAMSIREVSGVLSSIDGKKFQIEGHSDSLPIRSAQYPSNWELAAARALNVLNTLVEAGMSPDRISAATYGEFQPIRTNDTPENRALNRRIEIAVVPDLSGLPGFDELQRVSSTPTKK